MENNDYKKYEKLIFKLAHKWQNRFSSTDFDDLVSEGNVAYCIAVKKFDPTRGVKFVTYLYPLINNRMHDFVSADQKVIAAELPDGWDERGFPYDTHESPEYESPYKRATFKEWLERLSGEACFVLGLVFETPLEIIEMARTEVNMPKNTKTRIAQHLRNEGWKWITINGCFDEIKMALKKEI